MFKDDRFISILSGIVLMIAIGTVVQRGGPLVEYFTGQTQGVSLADDMAETTADSAVRIAVLANDTGLPAGAADRIGVVVRPACGKAFAEDGAVTYLPEPGCVGTQRLSYGIDGVRERGQITVTVLPVPDPGTALARTATEPETPVALPEPPIGAETPAGTPTDAEPPTETALLPEREAEPEPPALAEPQRPGLPQRPAQPMLRGLDDSAPSVALFDGASPVQPSGGPAPLALEVPDSGGIAPVVAAAPVAQPSRGATQAPSRLATRLDDTQGDDFAAASSRGGLLARPSRASTGAAPMPGSLALAPRPEDMPVRRQPDALATPDVAQDDAGPLGIAALAPAQPRVPTGDEAPALPSDAADTAEPALASVGEPGAPAAAPLPRSRPGSGADTAPATIAADAAPAAPEAPETLALAVPERDPAPLRLAPAPSAPRFGAAGADRVSHISAPPVPEIGRPATAVPTGLRPTATVSLARIDRNPDAFRSPGAPTIGAGPSGLDAFVPRAPMPSIGDEEASRVALVAPASGLGEVRNIGGALTIVPVETTAAPGELTAPEPLDAGVDLAALPRMTFDPDAVAVERLPDDADAGTAPAAQGAEPAAEPAPTAEERLAALPRGDLRCVTPPAMTYDPRPGGMTEVIVIAPCNAGQVVTLSYSGVELALRVDAGGKAQVSVPGFERNARAALGLPDGTTVEFDLPFLDTDRIVRVALAWTLPVEIELHALDAGAAIGSDGHVWSGNPKGLRDVERAGGGYLSSYASIDGFGDNLQIYTHVIRRSDDPQVVKLLVDFASRRLAADTETCGTGRYAAPAYRVIRSERGRIDRTLNRRLGAIACKDVPTVGNRLIERAVEDVIVSGR